MTMYKSYFFDKNINGEILSDLPMVLINNSFLVLELIVTGVNIEFRLENDDNDIKRPPKRIVEGYMNARFKSNFVTPEHLRMSLALTMYHSEGSMVSFPKPKPLFFIPAATSDSIQILFSEQGFSTSEIDGITLTDLKYF